MSNLLCVLESFRRHMDNGRWLFQRGMEQRGYVSIGAGCPSPEVDMTDVRAAVERFDPGVVIMWPRYEWDHKEWVGNEVRPEHLFRDWKYLLERPDILRVAVWHDAGSARKQQQRWHEDFKPHVYLSWYHPDSVMPFAPYIKREQIVRTYHVIDAYNLPPVREREGVAVVSGAHTLDTYPLRTKCVRWAAKGLLGGGVDVARHPGYAEKGTKSNQYAEMLSKYRVAICTASSYGFALRKIFEATAVGCKAITDLPAYDKLPAIDDNLIRVSPSIPAGELRDVIRSAADTWNIGDQLLHAMRCRARYDYANEAVYLEEELTCRATALRNGLQTFRLTSQPVG